MKLLLKLKIVHNMIFLIALKGRKEFMLLVFIPLTILNDAASVDT
ncbi:hypothetical protein T08_595 [Trichinella sp. T8]|nr:hypothetical protein T08_595 [Trichinella sp. T8]